MTMRVKQINAPLIRPALEKGAPPTRSPLPRPVPQRPMSLDVIDLRSFYASALGKVARRFVSRLVRARWKNCTGLSIMGIGYACPYLDLFVPEAVRVLAFMWAEPRKMDDPEVIRASLKEAGLDADLLLRRTHEDEVKQRLLANTQAAVERGVFGAPSFFVGDQLFFGKDQLRDVEEEIAQQKQAA